MYQVRPTLASLYTETYPSISIYPLLGDFSVANEPWLAALVMDDESLKLICTQSSVPRRAAQALVTTAYDDNLSAAIIEYGEVPRALMQGTIPIEFVDPLSGG